MIWDQAAATRSLIDHSLDSTPAAIAGEHRKLLWIRTRLYQAICRETAALRFSIFFEKPFVNLVNRRMLIRIVRFWRST